MSRTFITGVIAVASLVTFLAAAPARADNDDLKKFIGAAATLYLLGKVLEHGDVRIGNQAHGYGGGKGNGYGHDRHRVLPGQCVRNVQGRHDHRRTVLPNACLRHNGVAIDRLPGQCQTRFWMNGKARNGFALPCLEQRGYRIARR